MIKLAKGGEEVVVRLADEMKLRGGSHADTNTSDVKDNNVLRFLHDSAKL
jgi:hypothetical protein